jgi:hypothetical protein
MRKVALLFLLAAAPVAAQSPRTTADRFATWVAYTGIHPIAEGWRWQLEGQLRQTDGGRKPQQRLFRTAILRSLNSITRVGVGYGLVHTYPPAEFVDDPQPAWEHRSYEQLDLKLLNGPVVIDNRYRLEQRWNEKVGTGDQAGEHLGWTYTNRMRYQLRATIAEGGGAPKDGKPYVFGYDEVFLSFGNNVQYNLLDQNRLSLGAGYRFGPALSVELGYMNQITIRPNGRDVERNHTLVVGFSSEASMRGRR